MIELILSIVKFLMLVIGEIFEGVKRAREANEKYELDRKASLEIFDRALVKMREQGKQDSQNSGKMDDAVDEDLKRK